MIEAGPKVLILVTCSAMHLLSSPVPPRTDPSARGSSTRPSAGSLIPMMVGTYRKARFRGVVRSETHRR